MRLSPTRSDGPKQLGAYLVAECLGQGGMGVVYRAQHRLSGQWVAVKTVRVPHEGLLQSIRREIHALGRLAHPGIVRILDEGIENGMPWYAMELLEGVTLRYFSRLQPTQHGGWWTRSLSSESARPAPDNGSCQPQPSAASTVAEGLKAPRNRRDATPTLASRPASQLSAQSLRAILTRICRLCTPLAFLHGEGIVHRDLKPENVLIRPDGTPVLVDFGLLSQFAGELSREALELTTTAGTAAYMAPEQARGELVDARADLYALGCILYELLVGRPPFVGKLPAQILQQHLLRCPQPPSGLNAAVPPEVDTLVLRLLEKEPQRRLGYADDVAAELVRLGAEPGAWLNAPRPRAYLYRPRLAGREGALGELSALLEGLDSGSGGIALVGGESGIGKTRLVLEFVRKARTSKLRVLLGGCVQLQTQDDGNAGSGNAPLEPLRPTLRLVADHCLERGLDETERLLGRRGKVLAAFEPALAALPGQDQYPEPVQLDADAARVRLFTYLSRTLQALAQTERSRRGGLLLVLDDLQWADGLTAGFVEFLVAAGELDRIPLLLVGTYRSEESTDSLRRLLESPVCHAIVLGRLEEASVGELVGDMLAMDERPATFVRFLTRQSEGNPFFVAEYLRAAVAEGILSRDEQGHWQVDEPGEEHATTATYEQLDLPRTLLALVERRLKGLPPSARQLVNALSVLGRQADLLLLWRLTGLGDSQLLASLSELMQRQILEAPTAGSFAFVHDKLREVAYAMLAPHERQRLHRAAAEAIEQRAAEAEELLGSVAHHLEQGGDPIRARGFYAEAAAKALQRSAHEEALRLYERAETLGAGGTQTEEMRLLGRLLFGQAMALRCLHRTEKALSALERAECHARAAKDDGLVLEILELGAKTHARSGSYDAALERLEQALPLAADRPEIRIRILAEEGWIRMRMGKSERAAELIEQALAEAQSSGDPELQDMKHTSLGRLAWSRGDLREALVHFTAAVAAAERRGQIEEMTVQTVNVATLKGSLGDGAAVVDLCEKVLRLTEQTGDLYEESRALNLLGIHYAEQGLAARAIACYHKSLEDAERLQNVIRAATVCVNLGALYNEQGDLEKGLEALQRGQKILVRCQNREILADAASAMCDLQLTLGQLDAAEASVRTALELRRSVGQLRGQALDLFLLGRIQQERGDTAEARSAFEAALVLTEETPGASFEPHALVRIALSELHLDAGESAAAREYLARAEEGLDSHRLSWPSFLRWIVRCRIESGPEAIVAAERAIEVAEHLKNPELLYLAHAAADERHLTQGNRPAARRHIAEAAARLTQLAERILDPELRRSYLGMRRRCEILEMARRLGARS
jgi:eukaryotic-like serine/threonine-protein kinase